MPLCLGGLLALPWGGRRAAGEEPVATDLPSPIRPALRAWQSGRCFHAAAAGLAVVESRFVFADLIRMPTLRVA